MIRTGLIASTLALAAMAGIMFWAIGAMPTGVEIPLHWNLDGAVDRYGSCTEALWVLALIPGSALFTTILLSVVPSLDPRKGNLSKSAKLYTLVWVATMILLTFIHAGMAWSFVKGATVPEINTIPFVRFIIAGSAALFLILGNYMPKTRANWFLGIRTPWTLSSDVTWEKTHRLGGRLFMLAGVLGIIGAFTLKGLWLAFLLPGMAIPIAAFCMVYSYMVWRKAEDKHVSSDYIV